MRERLAGLFESGGKAEHIHETPLRVLGQPLQDNLLHRLRQFGGVLAQGSRGTVQLLVDELGDAPVKR